MGAAGSVLDGEQHGSEASKLSHSQVAASKNAPVFVVSLAIWADCKILLPSTFHLRISYESLDFVEIEKAEPLIQFPFQNILCWGSSSQNFQFNIFDLEAGAVGKRQGVLISVKTSQGKVIEDTIMSTVKQLMADMKQRAISDGEFSVLQTALLDEDCGLKEDWFTTIDQFTSSGRLFLAKQGMELLLQIGNKAPFEKFDLVCTIYERMLNKDSIQLLINTFEDPVERENLALRLKVDNQATKKVERARSVGASA